MSGWKWRLLNRRLGGYRHLIFRYRNVTITKISLVGIMDKISLSTSSRIGPPPKRNAAGSIPVWDAR